MTPRPRCGNDPRARLTPGDRAAIDNLRAFLEARAEEKKTVTDLDNARAALLKRLTMFPGFADALEQIEGTVRAHERAKAEVRRLGAPDALSTPPAVALSADERRFLTFALDQAAEEKSLGDGLTEADTAALEKLRALAAEEQL